MAQCGTLCSQSGEYGARQLESSPLFYMDEKASEDQKDCLTQIFSGQAGGHPATLTSFIERVLGVKSTPIEFHAEGKSRSLRIPGVAEAEIKALIGQGDAEVNISNHPLCVAPE